MYQLKDYFCDRFYWVKPNGVPSSYSEKMVNCIEWVLIFSKWDNSRTVPTNKPFLRNYVNMEPNRKNDYANIHQALMSPSFCNYIIQTFTKENGKVLDIFGGLGTTAIVCEQNKRDCVLIEKEKFYCEKAQEKINNYFNQIRLF